MEIKDVKIGDTVQIRKDIPTELLCRHGLTMDMIFELQRRGEVTVRDIQEAIPTEKDDWDSITLVDSKYFWPIEFFEPVNEIKKSKEEQVQKDIQTVKEIGERYGMWRFGSDPVTPMVKWLEDFGLMLLKLDTEEN